MMHGFTEKALGPEQTFCEDGYMFFRCNYGTADFLYGFRHDGPPAEHTRPSLFAVVSNGKVYTLQAPGGTVRLEDAVPEILSGVLAETERMLEDLPPAPLDEKIRNRAQTRARRQAVYGTERNTPLWAGLGTGDAIRILCGDPERKVAEDYFLPRAGVFAEEKAIRQEAARILESGRAIPEEGLQEMADAVRAAKGDVLVSFCSGGNEICAQMPKEALLRSIFRNWEILPGDFCSGNDGKAVRKALGRDPYPSDISGISRNGELLYAGRDVWQEREE